MPLNMNPEEYEIVKRCQAGDRSAFRPLVIQYQRMVFSQCLKMLGDEEEAKDIMQDTFVKAWQTIGRYDPRHAFSTWLYTIATRRCIDRLKQLRRLVPLSEDVEQLQHFLTEDTAHRQLENEELASIVRALTAGLGDKQRVVFTLCQLEGLESDEVEAITGMDAHQVKANLYVARQNIKKRLKKLGYE